MKNYIKPEIEITEFINETEITVLVSSNYDSKTITVNEGVNLLNDF